MFLKRLLFLKASLDNEGSLASFPVPFNDAKEKKDLGLSETQIANFEMHSDKHEKILMLQNAEEA